MDSVKAPREIQSNGLLKRRAIQEYKGDEDGEKNTARIEMKRVRASLRQIITKPPHEKGDEFHPFYMWTTRELNELIGTKTTVELKKEGKGYIGTLEQDMRAPLGICLRKNRSFGGKVDIKNDDRLRILEETTAKTKEEEIKKIEAGEVTSPIGTEDGGGRKKESSRNSAFGKPSKKKDTKIAAFLETIEMRDEAKRRADIEAFIEMKEIEIAQLKALFRRDGETASLLEKIFECQQNGKDEDLERLITTYGNKKGFDKKATIQYLNILLTKEQKKQKFTIRIQDSEKGVILRYEGYEVLAKASEGLRALHTKAQSHVPYLGSAEGQILVRALIYEYAGISITNLSLLPIENSKKAIEYTNQLLKKQGLSIFVKNGIMILGPVQENIQFTTDDTDSKGYPERLSEHASTLADLQVNRVKIKERRVKKEEKKIQKREKRMTKDAARRQAKEAQEKERRKGEEREKH